MIRIKQEPGVDNESTIRQQGGDDGSNDVINNTNETTEETSSTASSSIDRSDPPPAAAVNVKLEQSSDSEEDNTNYNSTTNYRRQCVIANELNNDDAVNSALQVITMMDVDTLSCQNLREKVSKVQALCNQEEEVTFVKQPDVVATIDTKFSELILPILTQLREEKVSQRLHYDSATLKPWSVIQAQKDYVSRTNDHRLDGQFNILRELVNSRAILKEHGVQMARQKLVEATHKQYMNYITRSAPFQSLMRDMMIVASGASQEDLVEATTDTFENNPKLSKLVEVLTEHFERKQAINESTRVIVFSQWRESVGGIVKMLEFQNTTLIKPAQFIGQASKKATGTKSKKKSSSSNYNTGQDAAGMNQAQQQRVLQQFGEGVYNVLVCTCVAEEGLDVS